MEDETESWRQVKNHGKTLSTTVYQRLPTGQDGRDSSTSKMIEIFTIDSCLLYPITELARSKMPLCLSEIQRATVQGILKLKKKIEGFHAHAYPSVGTDPPTGDHVDVVPTGDHGDVIPAADHGDVVRVGHGNVVPVQPERTTEADMPRR